MLLVTKQSPPPQHLLNLLHGAGVQHVLRFQPPAPCHRDAQLKVLQLALRVRIRADREAAAGFLRRADMGILQIETLRLAVDFEKRAGALRADDNKRANSEALLLRCGKRQGCLR